MCTLIAVYNSDGCVGRCDARCHKATTPQCHCICGGRYHGGKAQGDLEERVHKFWDEVLDAAETKCREEGQRLEMLPRYAALDAIKENRPWSKRTPGQTYVYDPEQPSLF